MKQYMLKELCNLEYNNTNLSIILKAYVLKYHLVLSHKMWHKIPDFPFVSYNNFCSNVTFVVARNTNSNDKTYTAWKNIYGVHAIYIFPCNVHFIIYILE